MTCGNLYFLLDVANSAVVRGSRSYSGFGHLARCLSLAEFLKTLHPELLPKFHLRTKTLAGVRHLVPRNTQTTFSSLDLFPDDAADSMLIVDSNLVSKTEAQTLREMSNVINLAPRGLAPCHAQTSILNTRLHVCSESACNFKQSAIAHPKYSLAQPLDRSSMRAPERSIHLILGGQDDYRLTPLITRSLRQTCKSLGARIKRHSMNSANSIETEAFGLHFEEFGDWPMNPSNFSPNDVAIVGAGQSAEEALATGLSTIIVAGSDWHSARANELSQTTGAPWVSTENLGFRLPKLVEEAWGSSTSPQTQGPYDGLGINRVALTISRRFGLGSNHYELKRG